MRKYPHQNECNRPRHTLAINPIEAQCHTVGRELPNSKFLPEKWRILTIHSNQWSSSVNQQWLYPAYPQDYSNKKAAVNRHIYALTTAIPSGLNVRGTGKITLLSVFPWKGSFCILKNLPPKGQSSNLAHKKSSLGTWKLAEPYHSISL